MFQKYPTKQKRIVLSFGIEKAILEQLKDEVTHEQFEEIVLSSYGLIHDLKLVSQLKIQIMERVYARIEELQTPKEQSKAKPMKKSFGTSFAEWLANLSATESCLYLADYDIEKALKYYWEEDFLLVQEAIKAKSAQDSQKSLIALEASMYGFGLLS